MRIYFVVVIFIFLFFSCGNQRVFEDNIEFAERAWKISEPAKFDFQITDTLKKYNLLMDVRNSLEYPYARLFVNYKLTKDSSVLSKEMIAAYLFDQKTGKPLGSSGLGDLYDHQFFILKNYSFKKPGRYQMKLEQFMRLDTIPGIIAVGLRVEEAEGKK